MSQANELCEPTEPRCELWSAEWISVASRFDDYSNIRARSSVIRVDTIRWLRIAPAYCCREHARGSSRWPHVLRPMLSGPACTESRGYCLSPSRQRGRCRRPVRPVLVARPIGIRRHVGVEVPAPEFALEVTGVRLIDIRPLLPPLLGSFTELPSSAVNALSMIPRKHPRTHPSPPRAHVRKKAKSIPSIAGSIGSYRAVAGSCTATRRSA